LERFAIMLDPDWCFWALPSLCGKLAEEAEQVARKARVIKIPKGKGKNMVVEYRFDIDDRFCGFNFAEDSSWQSKYALRLPHLDLRWPLLKKKYDKRGGRIMIQDFRRHYFGKDKRLTKKRCGQFFSNDKNFHC
jgi:hypothetical protein